jgi:hypothetical protein
MNIIIRKAGQHHRTRGPWRQDAPVRTARPDTRVKRAVGIAVIVLSALVLAGFAFVITSGTANAAVSPQAKTCAAFSKWDHARTTANLNAMMADTFTGTWSSKAGKYLVGDVAGLYGDVKSGYSKGIASDVKYTGEDCADV